ncbi:translation initiation factor IF-2 subunit gamma [Candidatus Woesearchaeota archaeon]|nr:translation initiation factor IF-2 subunit gamma [Candidatus Woesearchaeota archaeon]
MEKTVEQPVINIGMVGHVDHGKTTLLERLTGKWTDTHSEEVKRGITIKLGYADMVIYECPNHIFSSQKPCCSKAKKKRIISFIDAPGHETLMATMLSGAAIMDGAILLVAANEECPQPQTKEHLTALQIIGIKNIIIVQNKIDLVNKEEALKNYQQIKTFVKRTIAENAPIIPVSAQHKVSLQYILQGIEEMMPTPKRDPVKAPMMFIARSFDVNKPGTPIKGLVGGVLGGALKQGKLKRGEKVMISPGRQIMEKGIEKWIPIEAEVIDLKTGGKSVEEVLPGGSIAILTKLDPSMVKSDQLTGNIVTLPDKIPPLWYDLKLEPQLLEHVVGSKEEIKVDPIKRGEPLMLNVNSATTAGIVTNLEKNKIILKLKRPVSAEEGAKVAISRRIGTRWRLIGTALLKK